MRIGLVGCVKQKAQVPRPAAFLYTSTLFRGRVRYVERTCDRWFVLSALHGLVDPDTVLEPYDVTLVKKSHEERREWSALVLRQLRESLGELSGIAVEIHAGAPYRDFGLVAGLRSAGCEVEIPALGLPIGRQLSFYASR